MGTHLRYRLTEAATVRFTVRRRRAGRLVRGKCWLHRRAGKRCALTLRVRGSYSVAGARGVNRSRFRGRLRGRKIKPGRYYLVAVATDLAGNRSRAVRVAFRIRRR